MRSAYTAAAAAFTVVLTTHCASSAQVQKSDKGGVIALRDSLGNPVVGEENRKESMKKAREQMADHCGGPRSYKIVAEGEAVVGSNSTTSGVGYGTGYGVGVGSARTSSTDKTEWRVEYRCTGKAKARATYDPDDSEPAAPKKKRARRPSDDED